MGNSKKYEYIYCRGSVSPKCRAVFIKLPQIKKDITNSFTKNIGNLEFKVSKEKGKDIYYKRLGAKSLNKSLKNSLKNISDMKFEVEYKEGILFDSPKTGGFDFALYDEELNVNNYRNFCYGRKAIFEGKMAWEKELKKRSDWRLIAKRLNLPDSMKLGEEINFPKNKPTIIGEIQFANWALAYYDMFKVLHLDNLADLDLLVYVTATGDLNHYLSEGIVNFQDTKEILNKYSSILKVPIWLIGLDAQ